ncbi:MAG: hypothetical protein ACI841_000157 [Planctomycetota bacterium]|jgi:hypothetical protein
MGQASDRDMLTRRFLLCFRLFCLSLMPCIISVDACAQYKTEKHRELGVTISRPRKFEPIPTQPSEEWIKLYYREQLSGNDTRKAVHRRVPPSLRVIIIPRRAASTPVDDGKAKEPVPDDAPDSDKGKGSKDDETQKKDKPPVINFTTYLTNDWEAWSVESLGDGKRNKDYRTAQYRLTGPSTTGRGAFEWAGYAYTWEGSGRTIVLMGTCELDDYDEMSKLWRKVGDKLKLEEPSVTLTSRGESKWERHYRTKRASHPEYRAKVRDAVVGNWKVDDTDNYIFVYNTKDEPLLRKLMRDIEQLREEYIERFPPVDPDFDAVSTVRICKDKTEYIAYGGSPRSAGYWNHKTEELVLYDAVIRVQGDRPDDSNTYIVLYHEAFHQYIHYSTGELPPHSWFNEGYGDFFSGAVIKNGRVRKIGVNPWRFAMIKAIVNGDTRFAQGRSYSNPWVPWSAMIRYSQAEYYKYGAANYAQGWSMVYFLATARTVRDHDDWKKILTTYFQSLKENYEAELALLPESPDESDREEAGANAREAAVGLAFRDVDLEELERAWLEFMRELERD